MDVSNPRATTVIPNAAQGLRVLLVDHHTSCLMHMASVLEEKSYKVTTTEVASIALSLIRTREFSYDLVIAEVDMPEMGGFTLLNQILLIKEDIPIILMSSSGDMNKAKRALIEGACFFFFKPISSQDLINLWQHVFRKRGQRTNVVENKEDQTVQIEKSCDVNDHEDNAQSFKGKAACLDEGEGSKKPKNVVEEKMIKKDKLMLGGDGKRVIDENVGKRKNVEKGKKKKDEDDDNSTPRKRQRLTWTPELHQKFAQAIATLGEDEAHPKALLKEMSIPGLTPRHIASHLQKYRQQLNKIREQFLKDPPIFESMMIGKTTPLPQSMMMRKTIPSLQSMMMTKPTQHFHSHYASSFGHFGFAHPRTNLNRCTTYYQMDRFKNLLSNPTTNLPRTSNDHYLHANFGNQEFPKMNHVLNSADQKGYNDNNDAPTDNIGMNNVDHALLEAWTKELADALGADTNLHQEMNSLAKYNNVDPQSLQQECPSKEFSAACEELAPEETEFNMAEQNYSYEDLARILDDSYGGCKDIKGSSSEPPEEPLANNDNDTPKRIETEDFAELFEIFPDSDDDSL